MFLVVGDASNVLQLRILPTKLFQLIEWEKYKTDKPVQGQLAKMAKCILESLIGSAVEEICSGSIVGVNNTDSKEAQRPKLLETGAVGRRKGTKRNQQEASCITKYGSSSF